jgi:thiamine-monophosphate kinase
VKEFELIERYFQQQKLSWCNSHISLSIGDDCAILNIPAHQQLCISMDTLVEDVHFPKGANPYDIATRALCVTLSDLAAMSARPVGFTLGITLPEASPDWLSAFSQGLVTMAQEFQCPLMGGDTTKGPILVITIQVHGVVDTGYALTRAGACIGDKVYVSGNMGDGGGALPIVLADPALKKAESLSPLTQHFYKPLPKIAFAQSLIGVATSCLDVSDGLVQDLNHICKKSSVGIELNVKQIPMSPALLAKYGPSQALQYALSGGDDYQLAYTAKHCENGIHVGQVVAGSEVGILDGELFAAGFQHF